jgi:hypothetical protein
MCAATPVGDPPVERLEREALGRVAGDERMESAAEPIHLDDVPCLDALEPHLPEAYERPGTAPVGRIPAPTIVLYRDPNIAARMCGAT